MKLGPLFIFIVLFLTCAPVWVGYDIMYLEGLKNTEKFVQDLDKKGTKYKIIKHVDNIYEIQYKDTKK
jgi:hypothetical protein